MQKSDGRLQEEMARVSSYNKTRHLIEHLGINQLISEIEDYFVINLTNQQEELEASQV